MKRVVVAAVRQFLRSTFSPTPNPPEGFIKIKAADLNVGMQISLHDRPELEAATGRIFLIQSSGARFFVFTETGEGLRIYTPVLQMYWDDEVFVKRQEN
jgi:hypothetical protein